MPLDALDKVQTLDDLTSAAAERNLTPGWIKRSTPLLWREPRSVFVPHQWTWHEAKAGLDSAARLIGTDLAERRNLVMRNPVDGNDFATLRTLVCAYQTILPGEVASSHRHAPHAFRVILDSHGAWSIVDGEKHPMETGDVVLTPGWSWHGHGHDGTAQAYWFDGLDVPLTHLLEPMFFEEHPAGLEPVKAVTPDSPFRFTWAATQKALDAARPDNEGHFGRRIVLDTQTMPTITIHMQRWDSGFRSKPYRSTANQIFIVMQGTGTSKVGDKTFNWSFGDTIAAPCWSAIEHQVSEDAVLVSMSDEALQRFGRMWRFEALS